MITKRSLQTRISTLEHRLKVLSDHLEKHIDEGRGRETPFSRADILDRTELKYGSTTDATVVFGRDYRKSVPLTTVVQLILDEMDLEYEYTPGHGKLRDKLDN